MQPSEHLNLVMHGFLMGKVLPLCTTLKIYIFFFSIEEL